MGFFGKGSLSRSEPTWLEREKKRRGLMGVDTSEEVTGKRRIERREWKLQRARKEKEAIALRLKAEAEGESLPSTDNVINSGNNTANGTLTTAHADRIPSPRQSPSSSPKQGPANGDIEMRPANGVKTVRFSPKAGEKNYDESLPPSAESTMSAQDHNSTFKDEEHLQLSNEEAFFLVYGLGVLQVYADEGKSILPASSLLPLFRQHSYFPPRDSSMPAEPDDPFILSYVVYHHFRSLGWVVRSGVKFGVHYLLYNRGPVFSHAEFAVIILPSYSHEHWVETEERKAMATKQQRRTWWWLHCVNRVQAQVKKSLILCYVEVPPPSASRSDAALDIGAVLKTYKVREMSVRRWVPNRSRD
jgi:tRNA-splicing endonuclease subunit Sen2